jgi:hypothetical protein
VEINLVLNPGFELGTAGWDVSPGVGGLAATDATEGADAGSGHCLALEYTVPDGTDPTSDPGRVSQTLDPEVAAQLRGRQLSFQIRVTASAASVLLPFISSDGGETRSYGQANGQSWGHGWPGDRSELEAMYEPLVMQGVLLPDQEIAGIVFGVEVRQTCTARLDNASLVFGAAAVPAEACIPAGVLGYLSAAAPAPAARARSSSPAAAPPAERASRSSS